jgi:hypothetical protein
MLEQTNNALKSILSRAKVHRAEAQTAFNQAASELLKEVKQLCLDLAEERVRARQSIADAEQATENAAARINAHWAQVTADAQSQAQEMIAAAEKSRADAEVKASAGWAQVTADAKSQAQEMIAAAEKSRADAEAGARTYRAQAIADAKSQAQEIIAAAEKSRADAEAEAGEYFAQITAEAQTQAQEIIAAAEKSRADAETEASSCRTQIIADAETQAQETFAAAENLRADAEAFYAQVSAEADQIVLAGEKVRSEADAYGQRVRAEADAYHERVSAESQRQAQELRSAAEKARAEADAYRERLRAEADKNVLAAETVKSNAAAYAERAEAEADAYRERVNAESQKQAQEIINAAEKLKSKSKTYAERTRGEADAYRERVVAESEEQAREILADAKLVRSEANTYRDELVVATRRRCKDLQRELLLTGEMEDDEKGAPIPSGAARDQVVEKGMGFAIGKKPVPIEADNPIRSVRHEAPEAAPYRPALSDSGGMDDGGQILGLEFGGFSKSFPVSAIIAHRIINDSITGQGVVITFEPDLEAGLAFSRRVNEQELTFSFAMVNESGMTLMRDSETGSLWETLTGRAIQGPLKGHNLARVKFEHAGLFEWQQQHPDAAMYQLVA